ncbi:discoidin, CUB and LCCL domain-containing protein 1-like [Branchiostoma lanceolatum]|uniref:discoidin, CUB and LCCL domain-containing protein 1-like n=1 Tax=Branchiostoma lanceolatum TaxID=7740 RepID=UPI0034570B92
MIDIDNDNVASTYKVFEGNCDADTVKENVFVPAIHARYLRVVPWTWFQNGAAVRLELLGCDVTETTTLHPTTPLPQQTTPTTSDTQGGGQVGRGPFSTGVIVAIAVSGGVVVVAVVAIGIVIRRRRSSSGSDAEPSSAARGHEFVNTEYSSGQAAPSSERDHDRDTSGFVDNDLYTKASTPTGHSTARAVTGDNGSREEDNRLVENVIYETSAMN